MAIVIIGLFFMITGYALVSLVLKKNHVGDGEVANGFEFDPYNNTQKEYPVETMVGRQVDQSRWDYLGD